MFGGGIGMVGGPLGGIAGTGPGAIVGGLVLGVFENFSAAYLSAQYRGAFPMILLVLVILFRPQGLLGRLEERTV